MNFKKGDTVIYPQHGACVVKGTKKMEAFGEKQEYLILETVISEMVLKVPVDKAEEVGVRPPVSADELEDLVAVLAKPDPRVPSNWSRRFKNHQEKLKSGDVYQVAEVVRNLAARNRDASLSAAERTMYERARVNLISEISPALKVSLRGGRGVPRRRARQGRPEAGEGREDRQEVAVARPSGGREVALDPGHLERHGEAASARPPTAVGRGRRVTVACSGSVDGAVVVDARLVPGGTRPAARAGGPWIRGRAIRRRGRSCSRSDRRDRRRRTARSDGASTRSTNGCS